MRARTMLRAGTLLMLLSCAVGPRAMALLGCGVLETHSYQGEDCLLLAMDYQLYWLTDYGSFAAGDTVFVAGTAHVPPMELCGVSRPGIGVETIAACRGFDFGCGTLYDDGDCRTWTSPRYGSFGLVPWGGYQSGDTVQVLGTFEDALSWCQTRGLIWADSVTACSDTLTAVSPTTWGRLKALFR